MDFNINEEKEKLRKKYKKVSFFKSLGFAIAYIMYINSITYVIPFIKFILIMFKLDIYLIDIVGMVFECFFTSLPLLSLVIGDIEMKKIMRQIRSLSEIENNRCVVSENKISNKKELEKKIEENKESIQEAIDMFSRLPRSSQIAVLNEIKGQRNLDRFNDEQMADYLQDKFEDIVYSYEDEKSDGYTRKRVKKD